MSKPHLTDVVKNIEGELKCTGCILEKNLGSKPLILLPDREVKAIVITESP